MRDARSAAITKIIRTVWSFKLAFTNSSRFLEAEQRRVYTGGIAFRAKICMMVDHPFFWLRAGVPVRWSKQTRDRNQEKAQKERAGGSHRIYALLRIPGGKNRSARKGI